MRIFSLIVIALLFLPGFRAHAQDEPPFDILVTETCLLGKEQYVRYACIGASAQICMTSEIGGSTVGMGYCLRRELDWWDARLNKAYRTLIVSEEKDDKEYGGPNIPVKADALREMQLAWIKYRDALCDYEAAQWGGGTGAGPAYLSCLLTETGRQVFVLEDRSNGGG